MLRKAIDGCKVRVLMMHLENKILPLVAANYKMLKVNITENFRFFESLAAQSSNIEVRQLRSGIMHFSLSRSDRDAVVIQSLASRKVGKGPTLEKLAGFATVRRRRTRI